MIVTALVLFSLFVPQSPAPAATIPDTPSGRALKEFAATFNEGGEKRKAWVESRTTVEAEGRDNILKQDAEFLQQHGPVTVVRIMPKATDTTIMAIIRHAKTGAHGHLTLEVEAAAPYKVVNMRLRGATEEEIKGE